MVNILRPKIRPVIGPDGAPLSINSLPSSNTSRWVIRRKAEVVAAVHGGLITIESACQKYSISTEEYFSWERSISSHGLAGLRTTRIEQYRNQVESRGLANVRSVSRLIRTQEARENAQRAVETLAASAEHIEERIADLHTEITRQETYLKNAHKPAESDIALASLHERRANLANSLNTVHVSLDNARSELINMQSSEDGLTAIVQKALTEKTGECNSSSSCD